MKDRIDLQALLAQTSDGDQRVTSFALLALGIVESLAGGAMSARDAVRVFFHAENCLFVRKQLRHKSAGKVMSHGVQLLDLFDALSADEAQREFQRELAVMHSLCLGILEHECVAA